MILNVLNLLGALSLFLFGLYLTSNSLQEFMGERLRKFVPLMKSTVFNGVAGGAGLTASILTSKASTATIISLVGAGTLSLPQAVRAIMGANVGRTIIIWIIVVFAFILDTSALYFPVLALGFVCTMTKNSSLKNIGSILMSLAIFFLGISFTLKYIDILNSELQFSAFFTGLSNSGFAAILLVAFAAAILAAILQSSSAVVILSLVFVESQWFTLPLSCAMLIGANTGTTLSKTLLSSSRVNIQTRQAAVVHFLFNLTVGILALIFFNPSMKFVGLFSPALAIAVYDTLLNLAGICILVWFTGFIVKVLDNMFKNRDDGSAGVFKYIDNEPIGTAAISISRAIREIIHFAEVSHEGFGYVSKALNTDDPEEFEKYRMKLVEYEELSDKMEFGIAEFLNKVSNSMGCSRNEYMEIRKLLKIIGELESLGDSGENVSRLLEREKVHNKKLGPDDIARMNEMIARVNNAYTVMLANLRAASEGTLSDISNAGAAEDSINLLRDELREAAITKIGRKEGGYQSTNYFLDFIAELEAMGDFMINISQAALKENPA